MEKEVFVSIYKYNTTHRVQHQLTLMSS